MKEWQQDLLINNGNIEPFKSSNLEIYVMRHGKSNYLEQLGVGSYEETKLWDQDMIDMNGAGLEQALKAGEKLKGIIDSSSEVIIFSSPRARTIGTANIIAKKLKVKNIKIIESCGEFKNLHVVQILRSGGDYSPYYDLKTNQNREDTENTEDLTGKEVESLKDHSTGLRFDNFLRFILKNYASKNYNPKNPVFIAVTHNEVLESFISRLRIIKKYNSHEGIVPFGRFFKIAYNYQFPDRIKIEFPDSEWKFEEQEINI
ncbi:MAG: histidine phosphatase family protein [Patescibacteria group bacterium]|jgi:broad specificity phosphatase PhoE